MSCDAAMIGKGGQDMLYDAAIIGTGPAGLSAALTLRQRGKTVLWFGSKQMSGRVERSESIRNYPGFSEITGAELNRRLREQADAAGLEITDRMVTNVLSSGGSWMILAQNDLYQARTLLLATGASAGKGFEGEGQLLGRGVSYCATCDGFLYKGKTIAVFCGSRRFEHEAADLAGLAKTVYLQADYPDCGLDLPNVTRLQSPIRRVLNALPPAQEEAAGEGGGSAGSEAACASGKNTTAATAAVSTGGAAEMTAGAGRVAAVALRDGTILPVDGLFCLRESVAPSALVPGLALDGPHIAVNRRMETNLPGCYAAGDCTGTPYQLARSVGEGNVAAHSMLEYLAGQKE